MNCGWGPEEEPLRHEYIPQCPTTARAHNVSAGNHSHCRHPQEEERVERRVVDAGHGEAAQHVHGVVRRLHAVGVAAGGGGGAGVLQLLQRQANLGAGAGDAWAAGRGERAVGRCGRALACRHPLNSMRCSTLRLARPTSYTALTALFRSLPRQGLPHRAIVPPPSYDTVPHTLLAVWVPPPATWSLRAGQPAGPRCGSWSQRRTATSVGRISPDRTLFLLLPLPPPRVTSTLFPPALTHPPGRRCVRVPCHVPEWRRRAAGSPFP